MQSESGSGSNLKQAPKLPKQFKPLVPQNKPLTSPSLPVRLSDPAKYGGEPVVAPVNIPTPNMTSTQLFALRGRGSTTMPQAQVAAILNDVDPRAIQAIFNAGTKYVVDARNLGNSHYDPITRNVTLSRGTGAQPGWAQRGVVGHESVHAWQASSPWANPVVATSTALTNAATTLAGLAVIATKNPANKLTASLQNWVTSGYSSPLSQEWMASNYMNAQGETIAPNPVRQAALAGFLKSTYRGRRVPANRRW